MSRFPLLGARRFAAKRHLWLGGLVLLGIALGLAFWAYQLKRNAQQAGVAVYQALSTDGAPLPTGLLDDPAFKSLPAPSTPPSLGRYQAPAVGTSKVNPVAASQLGAFQLGSTTPLSQRKVHVLLLGNDQEQLGRGRADTLLSLTFDPQAQKLWLLSVPRDTRVMLPGHGWVKINAAYTYGGASLQTAAVERFLGVAFDKYVEVSLSGFRRAIDEVGGVSVTTTLPFYVDDYLYSPGPHHLDGRAALAYSRERYTDPQGDLGRNQRQQAVVRALIAALGRVPPPRLSSVVQQLSSDVRTNFSPSEVVKLRLAHAYALQNQQVLKVAGTNRKINGLWYYVVTDKERQRLHLQLR